MARTSKTRLSPSGPSADRAVRASAQGQQSVDRARSELNAENRAGRQEGNQNASRVSRDMASDLSRNQQADQFQSNQAQQGKQFDRQQANAESRTDLAGAQSGFERGGRAAQLEREMQRGAEQPAAGAGGMGGPPGALNSEDQARLQGQGEKPLEMDGKWRSTEEKKQQDADKQATTAFKADTDRLRAETQRDAIGLQYQRAAMEGKKDQQMTFAADLARPINQDVGKFDRMQNGESTDSDWGDISRYAGGSHDIDPTLHADIAAKNYTPRVQQFVRSHISRESLKFIVGTGSTADISNIDWTAPQMEQFTEQVANVNAMAKTMGPDFANMAGIKSVEDKMAFVRTQAAMMVLTGMDQYSQPDPSMGMPPSMGGQPPEGAPQEEGIDPNSLEAQDAGGGDAPAATDANTQEAIRLRKEGKYVPPADHPSFQRLGKPQSDVGGGMSQGYH